MKPVDRKIELSEGEEPLEAIIDSALIEKLQVVILTNFMKGGMKTITLSGPKARSLLSMVKKSEKNYLPGRTGRAR